MQGVTTAFIGNDGRGDPDMKQVLSSAAAKPVRINYAAYAGLGDIRTSVIGEANRARTAAELTRMRAMVTAAMCQGALGIHRSSKLAADTFKIEGHGRLRPGAFADIVVFDPRLYASRAAYEQPTLLAAGVETVIVNGDVAVDKSELTGKAAGRALPHTPTPGSCP